MTRRRRDLLVGLALALAALGGTAVQVDRSAAHRELPAFVCPLH